MRIQFNVLIFWIIVRYLEYFCLYMKIKRLTGKYLFGKTHSGKRSFGWIKIREIWYLVNLSFGTMSIINSRILEFVFGKMAENVTFASSKKWSRICNFLEFLSMRFKTYLRPLGLGSMSSRWSIIKLYC